MKKFLLIPILAILSALLVPVLNITLDRSAPGEWHGPVVGLTARNARGDCCRVSVENFPADGLWKSFDVAGKYQDVEPGTTELVLRTRSGRFGIGWVEEAHLTLAPMDPNRGSRKPAATQEKSCTPTLGRRLKPDAPPCCSGHEGQLGFCVDPASPIQVWIGH